MKQLNWNNNDRDNGIICLNNAQEVYCTDIKLAIDWTDQAISYFKGDKHSLCDLAQCYYIKALSLSNINKKDSRFYFTESIKAHILGSKRSIYKTCAFYKFVGVDIKSLDSILSRIRLTHPSRFNDPMDCPIATSAENGIPYIDLFNGLRVGCFGEVKDKYYLNASKWSYYGDFHKGICLEYDFSELEIINPYALMDKVKYRHEYTSNRGIVGSGLLTKSFDYVHEDEWRIIWYKEFLTTHSPKYIDIPPSMITKIYIGYKCTEDIKIHILEFKSKNPHIHVYKVQPSEDNFYQLCAKELI